MGRRRDAPPTLREWLSEGPYALGLSSGFFGFFAHAGFLAVLEDEGLVPTRLSGASAGALVAGLWASGRSAAHIATELLALERADFWDPGPGAGLLRGRKFRARLELALAADDFARCRVPVAVSAFDLASRRTRVFDRGALGASVHASCALPGLFHPVWIDGRPYLDGGIADRPGLDGMPRGERVLHHHLVGKSPWRRKDSPALEPPRRSGMASVVLPQLPRVGPFRLPEGARAYETARLRTRAALDARLDEGVFTAPVF